MRSQDGPKAHRGTNPPCLFNLVRCRGGTPLARLSGSGMMEAATG